MLHGTQRGLFELDFRIPAECADQMAAGASDIGIIPSFELTRQDLEVIPGTGIACHGAVRSILLVSSRPATEIRTLAVDSSSRTSVQLARVILERKYGASYLAVPHAPDLEAMLPNRRRGAGDRRSRAAHRSGAVAVPCVRLGRGVGGNDRTSDGIRGVGRKARNGDTGGGGGFSRLLPVWKGASGADRIDGIARAAIFRRRWYGNT